MKKITFCLLTALTLSVCAAEIKGLKEATTPLQETGKSWRKFWPVRFEQKLKQAQQENRKIDVVLMGDSITHNWESKGKKCFPQAFAGHHVLNLGFGGDRTQHTLWILEQDQLWRHLDPKLVVLMIGTNNTPSCDPEAIFEGIKLCIAKIKKRAPNAKIVLFEIFPRGEKSSYWLRRKINAVNARLPELADNKQVFLESINDRLMTSDGRIEKSMMKDFLHPEHEGYVIWAEAIKKYLP